MAGETNDGGKVWFITGTSSGFGRRLVLSALDRGDRVIATARCLEKALKGLPESENLRVFQLDVTDSETSIKRTISEVIAIWGRIDVLVNNAGFGAPAILEEEGTEVLRKHYDTNVFGVLNVTLAVLPHMRPRRSGTIVIIGSRSAWKTEIPGFGPYASSKAAVHAIGETLAVEIAPFSIRVLIVEPGSFRTEGIFGNPMLKSKPITDYYDLRCTIDERHTRCFANGPGKGDPAKAMDVLVDVVNGEGVAKGRAWPLYLILGEDAEHDVQYKCGKVLRVLGEWTDVARSTNLDDSNP